MNAKIQKIVDLFAIESTAEEFTGMLVPSENYINSYNKPAVYVYGKLNRKETGVSFQGGIRSIDDSSAVVLGPEESLEKAMKRLTAFKEFIEEYHPMMPPAENFEDWSQRNGCFFQKD